MMKNIIAGLFLVFYIVPGFCIDAFYMDNVAPRQAIENAIHDEYVVRVSGDAVQKAIETITQDIGERLELTQLYTSWMQDGSPLTFGALGNICDIAFKGNIDKCQRFASALLKNKALRLYSVCGADKGKTGGTERCVEDFFAKTKVDTTAGRTLASEYVRIKYNDASLECDKNVKINRTGSDYMRCVSQSANNVFYEFKFDSLADVHMDTNREDAIFGAICRLHGLEYDRTMLSGYDNPRCKTQDKNICAKVNETLKPFGFESKIGAQNWGPDYGAQMTSPDCVINALCTARNKKDLHSAFGLDPFEFQKSAVQVNRNEYLEDMLANYVQSKVGNITSFECNATHQCIYTDGKKSDVLGCKVNGKDVDFVFKDLSEWSRYRDNAGRQVIQCKIVGGEFTGQDCVYLTHEQCDKLAKQTIPGCPECTNVVWDTKHNICKLKTNEILNDIEKAEKVAMMAVGSAAAVATSVGIAYAAYKTGSVLMLVPTLLAGANAVGSVMELGATLKILGVTEDFARESQNCKTSACADNLVEKWLQRLSNLRSDLSEAEYTFVNKELARLIGLTSEQFGKKMFTNLVKRYTTDNTVKNDISSKKARKKMDEMLKSPDLLSANAKGFFDSESWEPEQIWRAVGVGLQIASTLGSVAYGFWANHQAYKAYDDETTQMLRDALTDGKNNLTPEERREIIKYLMEDGTPVKINDNIEIPGDIKLAAQVAKQDGTLTSITGETKYVDINDLDDYMREKYGSQVFVQYDKDMKAVYTANFGYYQDGADFVESALIQEGIPYSRQGNAIIILETDLEAIGVATVAPDDPMITKLVKVHKPSVDELHAQGITTEVALSDFFNESKKQRAEVSLIFGDSIDKVAVNDYAKKVKDDVINIIANNETLSALAVNYDNLSTDKKMDFINGLLSEYNAGKAVSCVDGYCELANLAPGVLGEHLSGSDKIYLSSKELANASLPDVLDVAFHENNHRLDAIGKGFLNNEQRRISSITGGLSGTNIDAYLSDFTEQVSYAISNQFQQKGFTEDLNKAIKRVQGF